MPKKDNSTEACCLCKCHVVSKWVWILSVIGLGVYGIYTSGDLTAVSEFVYALSWVLVVNGAMTAASKLCRCCCQ